MSPTLRRHLTAACLLRSKADSATGNPLQTEVEILWGVMNWEVTTEGGEHFHPKCFVELYWFDWRMVGFPTKGGPPSEVWRPSVMANKGCSLGNAERFEQTPQFPRYGGESSEGYLTMHLEVDFGESGLNMAEDDLERMRAFPFDSLRVDGSIFFVGGGNKEALEDIKVSLRKPTSEAQKQVGAGEYQTFGWNTSKVAGDYEMVALSIAHGRHAIPVKAYREPWYPETVEAANLLFSFHLRRRSEFYLMKAP